MLVYRIAPTQYIEDLSGRGAELHGGRWNKIGIPAVYTSEHRSLCALELLANANSLRFKMSFSIIELIITDNINISTVPSGELPPNWFNRENYLYTSTLGTNWLVSKKTLVLEVPSAIIPDEKNYILNPYHPDFSTIKINNNRIFNFDNRLIR